jgi:hypothetical protein
MTSWDIIDAGLNKAHWFYSLYAGAEAPTSRRKDFFRSRPNGTRDNYLGTPPPPLFLQVWKTKNLGFSQVI